MSHLAPPLNFRTWLEMSSLRDILSGVPQEPSHHPEGDTFTHVVMVRKSMDQAVELFRAAQQKQGNAFEKLNFNLDDTERQILQVTAWMHDIGKAGATTFRVGDTHIPWQQAHNTEFSQGRWQALQHERPKYYMPQMRRLADTSRMWQSIWRNTEGAAKKDVLFIINHHMDLRHASAEGLPKSLANQWIGADGQYVNRRRVKLLLVFFLMDRLGRGEAVGPVANANEAIGLLQRAAERVKSRRNKPQNAPAPDDPVEFLKSLGGKPDWVIPQAFKGKFGRTPTQEELDRAKQ